MSLPKKKKSVEGSESIQRKDVGLAERQWAGRRRSPRPFHRFSAWEEVERVLVGEGRFIANYLKE